MAKRLHGDWTSDPAIPIVTGFLGKVFLLANLFIHFLIEKIAMSTSGSSPVRFFNRC